MDNSKVGGTGDMAKSPEIFGSPESFEGAFEAGDGRREVRTNELGERARVATEMLATPDTTLLQEAAEIRNWEPNDEMMLSPTEIEDFPGITESRPLASDGSTEGKIDSKKIISFDGEVMDKDSVKEVEKAVKAQENDPFELDNIRNQMMVDGLRDNYGRIFGDDEMDDEGGLGEKK
ncbi:hypothetical protein IJG78_03190 [Candidatus Saccharibacteria bacterium]|nr:hypothetical protein [Candidatus Saccharibacteria bacterium]